MRRASAALLARAAAGLASTSGPPAPALTLRALSPAASSSSSFTTLHPPVGGRWWRPEYRTVEAGGRTFAALPAAGEKDVRGSGVNGGPPLPPAPPRRSSVSGHVREVTVADIGIPQAVQTARDVLHVRVCGGGREAEREGKSTTVSHLSPPPAAALTPPLDLPPCHHTHTHSTPPWSTSGRAWSMSRRPGCPCHSQKL